ncbi:DUF2861 family protein [Psychromonas aquimarina]|uniref:DUF2861 family protein n=1 Tax=Psychromonas aquimarina TaxID=444919 RepID=UPI00040D91EA|nr:DUF2861 family protein [Psychromonas aquimarina]
MPSKLLIHLLAAFIAALSTNSPADNWFAETPLASAYSALANNNPELAWQEMQLALAEQEINPAHWSAVKNAIIEKTQCGRLLSSSVHTDNKNRYRIKLSLQQKTNLVQQSFQLKVAIENPPQGTRVELTDRRGKVWLSGITAAPQDDYIEVESNELLNLPKPGYFELHIADLIYPLVLSRNKEGNWLELINDTQSPLAVYLPTPSSGCAPAKVTWQWFTQNFQIIGWPQPVSVNGQNQPQPPGPQPENAKWLSTTVSTYEYQGGVKVEYLQRLTVPAGYYQF